MPMPCRRRALLWLSASMMMPALAAPQSPRHASTEAVPWYTSQQWIRGVDLGWQLPRGRAFEGASQDLRQALAAAPCSAARLRDARPAWILAMTRWESLAAAEFGPVTERRSSRLIDFQPTRTRLVDQALAQPPASLEALDSTGTAGKGLPALEYLLWQRLDHLGACAYAALLAEDLAREATALRSAMEAPVAAEASDEASLKTRTEEFLNQLIGGVESLRWHSMGKPLESAVKGRPPAYPRRTSAAVREAWMAQWGGLRGLMQWRGQVAPAASDTAADGIPLSLYLRGRGQIRLADRLEEALDTTDRAMGTVRPGDAATVRTAMTALSKLRSLLETQIAEAMQVSIQFTSADGD